MPNVVNWMNGHRPFLIRTVSPGMEKSASVVEWRTVEKSFVPSIASVFGWSFVPSKCWRASLVPESNDHSTKWDKKIVRWTRQNPVSTNETYYTSPMWIDTLLRDFQQEGDPALIVPQNAQHPLSETEWQKREATEPRAQQHLHGCYC